LETCCGIWYGSGFPGVYHWFFNVADRESTLLGRSLTNPQSFVSNLLTSEVLDFPLKRKVVIKERRNLLRVSISPSPVDKCFAATLPAVSSGIFA